MIQQENCVLEALIDRLPFRPGGLAIIVETSFLLGENEIYHHKSFFYIFKYRR